MGSADAVAYRVLRSDTGTLPGGHPYASVGTGDRALVVLPGLDDSMFSGVYPPFAGWALAPYFARYLDSHAVYQVSRPRGLPAGYDADDAVASHVRALESIADSHDGVDLLGISVGGLIAQALGARTSGPVDRFVVANSACRLADEARPIARRFERYAREHDWGSIRSELAAEMYSDGRAVAYPPMLRTIGRFLQPRPAEPADVWRSLEFALAFDACDDLDEIEEPTLVFAGENDPFFPPECTRTTAERLPRGELEIVSGAKHAAFHERKFTFDSAVRSFFERTAPLAV